VTGSPFHQEIFDPRKVKLESEKTSGFVGNEMSLDSTYIFEVISRCVYVCDRRGTRSIGLIFIYSAKMCADEVDWLNIHIQCQNVR